jgi:lysozyme
MAMPDFDRATLRAELIRDEGLRLKAYRCTAGKRTIGVGRNLDDVGISASETKATGVTIASCIAQGVSRETANLLLDNDIDRCVADLDRKLPWWRTLAPVRQRVLLNMCFNLGVMSLCGFRNTLAMMQAGRFADAAANMLKSKWAGQVGARATRLSKMMRTGAA